MSVVPKVYTWEPNSNSGKPLFALCEKGVAFEHIYISITAFDQHDPAYLALNPAGTVPTLVHGEHVLTESTPMCEYIDAVFPGGTRLVPEDPATRYRAREWARRMDGAAGALSVLGWHSSLGPMVRAMPEDELERLIARIPTKERQIAWRTAAFATFTEQQLQDARDRCGAFAAAMDAQLAHTEYLAGDAYSIADLVALANYWRLPTRVPDQVNWERVPHFMAWLKRMHQRPGTQRAAQHARLHRQGWIDFGREIGALEAA